MIIDNPTPGHIPALRRLWKQAFGDSDVFLDSFFASGFSCNRCRCVFSDGEPVAAVYFLDCLWNDQKVAYLYALAVDETHQKQGLSRLLLGDTHAHLQQAGYQGAMMEPATESLGEYYGRLGYRPFGSRREMPYTAAGDAIHCYELGKLGYRQARQAFLPENSIVPEDAFIDFIHSQAVFYGGGGFVATVSRSDSLIMEFLGDTEKIPGLLTALGLETATVRLPGGENHPVYLDFFGEKALPSYFGFPMD